MNRIGRRDRHPRWRVGDARAFRPELVLIAVVVLSVLLLEVWQSSTVASLSMQLERANRELRLANADLEYARSQSDRRSTRAELAPVASSLGLEPVAGAQVVALPVDYLAEAREGRADSPKSAIAWAGRTLQSLVPDAMARGRVVN